MKNVTVSLDDETYRWARVRAAERDAAIVEAARTCGCDRVCSEDLRHGQDFGGVKIVNPFVESRGGKPL